MAGHSKWHNIKHRKASQDAKKAQIYSKLAKQVQLEAMKGADPSLNPSLSLAISKAKSAGVPKPVIEKAINKGSGQDTGETLQEVFYEGYGPSGVAIYVKCITSNTNRSAANVRAIFAKHSGNMGQEGSVAWQFSPKGVIIINGKLQKDNIKGKQVQNIVPLDVQDFEEKLLELSVEDYKELEAGVYKIITSRQDLMQVVDFLKKDNYNIESYDIEFIPENTIKLSEKDEEKLEKLINALEEDEDVDNIFHNAEQDL